MCIRDRVDLVIPEERYPEDDMFDQLDDGTDFGDVTRKHIVVDGKGRDGRLLQDALEEVMKSEDYKDIGQWITNDLGGLVIKSGNTGGASAAHWNWSEREIVIAESQTADNDKWLVAGHIAFEMANAAQFERVDKLLSDVQHGKVSTGAQYADRVETIEYETAQIRSRASKVMIAAGKWSPRIDPFLKHFLQQGESVGGIQGDGLWRDYNDFLRVQLQVRHWGAARDRFERLRQRKQYLKTPEGQHWQREHDAERQAVDTDIAKKLAAARKKRAQKAEQARQEKIAAARERFQDRKAKKK
eukprot:TRINITY_DN14965_c0_g1_i1.p1 TRINITY_DN14965_c0_g1~~TRINITY_DN14965_c0_g1_i1.p1  ORF type:complete len:300 (-),score=85.78 TRINITY_DN14965_c0_g1_i1:77-976(-)